jgi:hypothetical protein
MYEYLVSHFWRPEAVCMQTKRSDADFMLFFQPMGNGRWDVAGHEGYMNMDVASLPEILQDAGYHTLHSGTHRS